MCEAIALARPFRGATAPNPPVGALVISQHGEVIGRGAHPRAGEPHAEILALRGVSDPHTLVVTLSPCNHTGRTPPCTEAILAAGIRCVIIGAADPNRAVRGGAVDRLKAAGIEVLENIARPECEELIVGFATRAKYNRPYVKIKRALRSDGSMIPPHGQKTFTSIESLRRAHQLRKESDAIVTGSGTVLADEPLFTVRHVPDHDNKRRTVLLLDRRSRVSPFWEEQATQRGLQVLRATSWEQGLCELADQGVLEVLVEAGPKLSAAILQTDLWDQEYVIQQTDSGEQWLERQRGGEYQCLPALSNS